MVNGLPDTADFWFSRTSTPTVSSIGYQGELHDTVNGTVYCLVFLFGSCDFHGVCNDPQYYEYGIWINSSYGVIPMYLGNATSFTLKAGNCTYINGLPTITDNVTFNDGVVDTYGHGTSTFSLTLSQIVFYDENSTEGKVKIGVYANLTGTKFYLPSGSELPQGTKYSLNLQWIVGLSSWAAVGGNPANPVGYEYVASGSSLTFVENNSQHTPLQVGNMSLGDSFTEMQGTNRVANGTATATFEAGHFWGSSGIPNAYCNQCFYNLTYGTTTGVLSDPTIGLHYSISPSGSPPLPTTLIVGVGVGVAAVAVIGVVLFRRKIKK
jgi:hypothetical protein